MAGLIFGIHIVIFAANKLLEADYFKLLWVYEQQHDKQVIRILNAV